MCVYVHAWNEVTDARYANHSIGTTRRLVEQRRKIAEHTFFFSVPPFFGRPLPHSLPSRQWCSRKMGTNNKNMNADNQDKK